MKKDDKAPLDDVGGTVPLHRRGPHQLSQAGMTSFDLLVQQVINGVSLGSMYALIALGFTLVYGIMELINFSHFYVFMVGSFHRHVCVWRPSGSTGQTTVLAGAVRWSACWSRGARRGTMIGCGILGVVIERLSLRPAAQREGAVGDDHHHRRVLHPVQPGVVVRSGRTPRTTPIRCRR